MTAAGTGEGEGAIEVVGLTKRYGPTCALDGVGFCLRWGEVLAYLGPNGAGKTTTVNILAGLVRRNAGQVHVCGLDIDRDPVAVKQRIGVVPETSNLYPELSCRRNLEYLGELYGLSRGRRRDRAAELLTTFDLADRAGAHFGTLSRGMKRRLTVAAALVHSPRVLFLDEPTAGLDVPSARGLRDAIRSMNRDGTTVFLTTHNLAEAESLAGRVIILAKGRIVAEGTSEDIRRRAAVATTIRVAFSGDVAAGPLRDACPAVQAASFDDGTWRVDVSDTHAAVAEIVAFAEQRGLRVLEISASGSLEDAFMTILGGETGPRGGAP